MGQNRPELLLTVPPHQLQAACVYGLPIGHMAYRLGQGGHLLRSGAPVGMRGGLMVLDDTGWEGGDAGQICREILRECASRGFDGIICDWEQKPAALSGRVIAELGDAAARRGWPLYVPEAYGAFMEKAHVLIPSALSGGSLRQRLLDAGERFGTDRLTLAVQRSAEDFFLPSPAGSGVPLTQDELKSRIHAMSPSVFFSDELCAHYFTYMSRQSGAHFVLFDDAGSIRKKLMLSRALWVKQAVLAYPEVSDLLPALLS